MTDKAEMPDEIWARDSVPSGIRTWFLIEQLELPSTRYIRADLYDAQAAEIERLRAVLEFYADPESYFAIGFFPDEPCGEFIDDFEEIDDDLGWKPGKRAREALMTTETHHD